jgi:uncharacterized repeat protein (TIGR01451 family)
VINVVNTNIINSPGILAFFNTLFGNGFDLRSFDLSYFLGGSASPANCSLNACDSQGNLIVDNNNAATVSNTLIVRASTGGNTANATGAGGASVSTGNAYASGNVLNFVNTNIINSNYLLVSFNNFGNMAGDITLPGADFFSQLFGQPNSTVAHDTTVTNNNTATVNNNTTAQADTGGNTASSTSGSAFVQTGNAVSGATTYNQVNTNSVGGTRVFMLFNIIGNWNGSVQGLPPGIQWTKTPTGIALTSASGDLSPMLAPTTSQGGTGSSGLGALTVTNTNNATVNNNVEVYALTGANQAASASTSNASVSTGNAYASANTVNMVNTNVLGQNWIFAIFNIFGDWAGNLSFGRPDLWIGGVAQTPNPTSPGSQVTYHFTVSNRGDADATNVTMHNVFNKAFLFFPPSDKETSSGDTWNLGTIKHGETKEFTYTATAANPQGGTVPVPLQSTLTADQSDNNPTDNSENVTIMIGSLGTAVQYGAQGRGEWTPDPKITMLKSVSVSTTTAPGSVDYKVTIHNDGGTAYNTTLTDTLSDPSGSSVYNRSWDIGDIFNGDDITLTYSVKYNSGINLGTYTNTAELKGQKNNKVSVYAVDMDPIEASASVAVIAGGEVLGEETSQPMTTQCAAFITSYLRPGSDNNTTQVRRLQYFLRDFQGAKLPITGIYDNATVSAVKDLQNKYAPDILTPWGITGGNGLVYYTTQKKINEIYCQGISQFPLSSKQMKQIAASHNTVQGDFAGAKTVPQISSTYLKLFTPGVMPALLSPSPAAITPLSEKLDTQVDSFTLFEKLFNLFSLHLDVPEAQAAGF